MKFPEGAFNFVKHISYEVNYLTVWISKSHLPITCMQNRDQYIMFVRGVSGLAFEESKMHTFSRI